METQKNIDLLNCSDNGNLELPKKKEILLIVNQKVIIHMKIQ